MNFVIKYIIWKKGKLLKNKKMLLIIPVTLLLIAAFVCRVYIVNAKYGKITAKEYKANEKFEYNGLEYMVTGQSIMEAEDEEPGAKIIIFNMKIENNTDEVQECDLTQCVLDFNHNAHYPGNNWFCDMNSEKYSLLMNIYPGAKLDIKIPYLIFKRDMKNGRWQNDKDIKCEIAFQLYPVRKTVKINLGDTVAES